MTNGLKSFAFHTDDPKMQPAATALRAATTATRTARAPASAREDPETVARRHLSRALALPQLPGLLPLVADGVQAEFRILGTEAQPITKATTVKFRQTFHKIPVYGSLVTVELDETNELLAIHSATGEPSSVDPVAKLSPAGASEVLRTRLGASKPITSAPRLCFYFDDANEKWRLVYVFEDLPAPRRSKKASAPGPLLMDYIVDAHSGDEVAALPRTPSVGRFKSDSAKDELGELTEFVCFEDGEGRSRMQSQANLHTHDLQFGDIFDSLLPGRYVGNPPEWSTGAVSAHANAEKVVAFLTGVLQRDGVDGHGGKLVSSINCVVVDESPDGKEWRNAAWLGGQMVYGQRKVGGVLRSYAAALDVVAHEVFHGVTDHTARLQYLGESGALNESYSDIFGIIVSNAGKQDPRAWNWELGEDLEGTGVPVRDLSNPTKYGQPQHMNDYRNLSATPEGDWGGVHINSGIHNFAAYLIMTAEADGSPLFTPVELASLFYLGLTQYLSRTSRFGDARRATELAARTLFRSDAAPVLRRKLTAVSAGFDAVGIL